MGRPPDPPIPVEVAAAVIERDGRYLIARRRAGTTLAGYWEFPGGKREGDESLEDCVRREVKEETGLCVKEATPIDRQRYSYPHALVDISFFHCTVEPGEPRPIGGGELRWASREHLSQLEFPPANRVVLHRLAARRPLGP